MSSDPRYVTKENLDTYLKELAKAYRKRNGKAFPAEIILIGGAAILANYGFRDMTTDVDAIIHAASSMKDAINWVGDKYGLPNGWLNADFMRSGSYSPNLHEYSTHYKTYANVLTIRTVRAEYLIAMKLRSGRKYKNDLSDIIGILAEHEKQGSPISAESIDTAVRNLYDGWESIPEDSITYIRNVLDHGNFQIVFAAIRTEERRTKDILVDFEENYPGAANTNTVDMILKNLEEKRESRAAIIERLRVKQTQQDPADEDRED